MGGGGAHAMFTLPCPRTLFMLSLIQQLRQGVAVAGYQFMRDYYPGVYRYLLFLTGRLAALVSIRTKYWLLDDRQ